jgi:hypothetical protein
MQGSTPRLETIFSWARCRLDVPACFILVERVGPDSFDCRHIDFRPQHPSCATLKVRHTMP